MAAINPCRRWQAPILLILLAGIIVYANTFQVPFILDDVYTISENPVFKNMGTFYLNATAAAEVYPPRIFAFQTFALNYYFGGIEVTGYHLVNLLIHLITAFPILMNPPSQMFEQMLKIPMSKCADITSCLTCI